MQRRPYRPKKATQTQNTGQQGVNLVEEYVLRMNFVWNPIHFESGIDGVIEIVETATGAATNRIVQVQVKATAMEFQSENPEALSFSCEPGHIDYWLRGNAPVILIVCRPLTREAYWKDVKAYFSDPANLKRSTVRFDKKKDKFDASTAPQLANLAQPEGGLHLGPLPKPEKLISNLFPLEFFPPTIWSGASTHKSREEFTETLKNRPKEESHLREFFLTGTTIYSFLDLTKAPLAKFVETGTVETNPSEDWAITENPDFKRNFVQLLNRCLRQFCHDQKIAFSPEKELFYFMWENKKQGRRIRAQSLKNLGIQSVAEWHKSAINENDGYFRHKAFECNFVRYDDQWFLEITPTYHFTSDGRTEYWNAKTLLAGIKRLDRHQAVRGNLLMWRHIFSEPDLTKGYKLLRFGSPLEFDSSAGIDDVAWQRTGVIEIESEEDETTESENTELGEETDQLKLQW
jgi:Domain of unknown function (DUF4365)